MYECMCVCVYVCMYVCIYACTHPLTPMCAYALINTHTPRCVYINVCMRTLYIHTNAHAHARPTHAGTPSCVHTCAPPTHI